MTETYIIVLLPPNCTYARICLPISTVRTKIQKEVIEGYRYSRAVLVDTGTWAQPRDLLRGFELEFEA